MLQIFNNGRFYILLFVTFALICVTILGALGKIDDQSIVAIVSALIGGAIGHATGAVQGIQEAQRRQTNGPPVDPPKGA